AHSLVIDGKDPIEERNARKAALALQAASTRTFKWCAETYIRNQESQWRNAKHRQQWGNTLETYAFPAIGNLAISDVSKGHVLRILEPIWVEKNETAARLRGRIETVWSWAKARGYCTGDNPAAWKGNLKEALPKISRTKRIKHHPALPYAELPA